MKITLCGSIAFYPKIETVRDRLMESGHEVQFPQLALALPEKYGGDQKLNFDQYIKEHGGVDAFPPEHEIWDLKEGAIKDHFKKIEWSDAILVVNCEKRGIEGYIGGSTLIEIGLAFYLGKKIYILNPISSELSYKQEIYGMKPILLNDDLSKCV